MAGRRCISEKVVESDAFYNLTEAEQALYFHLNMKADDDGFLNNAQTVASRVKNGKTALRKLVEKRFLLQFGDVYVIKHWRISNSLKNDRLKPLTYASVAANIWVKPNRAYTDHPGDGWQTLHEIKTGIRLESAGNPFGIRTEPNRTEPNRTEPNRTPDGRDVGDLFGDIWLAYPELRRGSRQEAMKAYKGSIMTVADAELALRTLSRWKNSKQWSKSGGQYVPYLCNWLERGLWAAEPAEEEVPKGASGELGPAEIEAIERIMREG